MFWSKNYAEATLEQVAAGGDSALVRIECTCPKNPSVSKAVQEALVQYLKEAEFNEFKMIVSLESIVPSPRSFMLMATADFGMGGVSTKEKVEAGLGAALASFNNIMKEKDVRV